MWRTHLHFDVGLECFVLFVSPIILVSRMLRKAERCKAKCVLIFPECIRPTFGIKEGSVHSSFVYFVYLPKEKQFFIPYLNGVDMFRNANVTCNTVLYL